MEHLVQDPIFFIAVVLFIGTLGILGWAIMKLRENPMIPNELNEDEPLPQEPPAETTGLVEARLQEISTQLTEINKRLAELEKSRAQQDKTQNITLPPSLDKAEMEKFVQRIESRLEVLSEEKPSSPPVASDAVARLEGKLEGIHKLLILLTDSGSPEEK